MSLDQSTKELVETGVEFFTREVCIAIAGAAPNEEHKALLIKDALSSVLVTPDRLDSNLESANVVDGLFAIADGLKAAAEAIDDLTTRLEIGVGGKS